MAVATYALCNNLNVVQNIVQWDGIIETWAPPPGITARLTDGFNVNVGDTFDGNQVTPGPANPLVTAVSNREQLLSKAKTALANNATFLAIPSPTQGQSLTQIQALTRQMDAIIRVVGGYLDSQDGT